VSLANAFLKPAKPIEGKDLVDVSVASLEDYMAVSARMGSARGVIKRISVADRALPSVEGVVRAKDVGALIEETVASATQAARA
jgi:hypothetical protein